MGNPIRYYRMALQSLCYYLNCNTNMELAQKLKEEEEIDALEWHVLEGKDHMPQNEFYFYAGFAFIDTLKCADEEGNDALNASFGGLTQFEKFIELRKDEDNDE